MQTQLPDKRCIICDSIITNPICVECVNNELRQWFNENNLCSGTKIKLNLLEQDNNEYYIEKCLLCKNPLSICTHCYYHEIFEIIKEKFPKTKEEFKIFFGLLSE
jgi:phosphoribosyl-dephospho-CoA transferase